MVAAGAGTSSAYTKPGAVGTRLVKLYRHAALPTRSSLLHSYTEHRAHLTRPPRRWYSQAGTPHLHVSSSYDAAAKTYTLHCRQHTPPTNGQEAKLPVLIPIRMGLLGPDGERRGHTHEQGGERVWHGAPALPLAQQGALSPPAHAYHLDSLTTSHAPPHAHRPCCHC